MKDNFELNALDWSFYDTLKKVYEIDSSLWVTKEELISHLKCFYGFDIESKKTGHDICSTLNQSRLKLNAAAHKKLIHHVILLNNNCFKIASCEEEYLEYAFNDLENGLKLLKRYYLNLKSFHPEWEILDLEKKISEDLKDALNGNN